MAYAKAWTARHRKGPLTRAFLDVLAALLWQFHNARTGTCFPSYDSVAERAGCARSTVAAAVKALEFAGVLSWQNRITRIRQRCADLFGRAAWRWQVIRTSNAYVLHDPLARAAVPSDHAQDVKTLGLVFPSHFRTYTDGGPLDHALKRLGDALKGQPHG
jgi:hypothetical protein